MGKGSQLTQLKSAITQAGLNGRPPPSKKRKRSGASKPDQVDKEKKAAKLKEIQQKLNPFDVKVTKLKHDVGGRKIKGVVGKPAQSKQAGIEERRRTLLKEYETKNHAGGVVDRRFGENDPSMSLEERMLERFTKERQRASKGDLFNLEDDDADMELTHYGQSLSKLDDFDGAGLALDEDEDEETRGQIDSETVKAAHFGGFDDEEEGEGADGEPPRKKTKAEVMAEVIAKSKEHKYRRQAEKEEDQSLLHELDADFDALRTLLASSNIPEDKEKPVSELLGTSARDAEYEQVVRELAFEKRAKPKDRTKTEEELALEEKERLERAERRRVRRMQGLEDESEDEEGEKKGRGRGRGGDDLEDDFYDAKGVEWDGVGVGEGLKEEGEGSGEEDESVSASEEESEEGEDESEEGEGEWVSEDESDEEGEEGEHEDLVAPQKKRSASKSNTKGKSKPGSKELPYTFPAPQTHEDFLEIIEDVAEEDVPTVVQRIRTLHHPSLAEDNKFKLQALTGVLIDHILYITSPPTPRFSLLSALVPHLAALTEKYPIPAAEHFRDKLILMHKNLKRGLSHGPLDPESKTWPGLPELSLLRVIGAVWSTSDMKHPVISPARLLMGAYLGLARVRSLADVASGLFLCTLFAQYEARAKRFAPEAVNFAANAVLHLAPHAYKEAKQVPGFFPCPDFKSEACGPLAINCKQAGKLGLEAAKPDLGEMLGGAECGEQQKLNLLGLALDLLRRFAEMYKGLEGFIELYDPILEVLQSVESQRLPQSLKERLSTSIDMFTRLLKFARQARRPLQLQAHKPIPIPSYIPKFESSSSNYLRNRDPDHERNEAAKLRRQYKQEKKGALRELRKDTRFLAEVQQKEQMEKDKRYNDRMKRVFGSIESERAEQKAMEREKAKEKKRAGRK
ncbi:Nop14-like protein [Gloeophyllum trabeum ATCC 11539]|uniref:Nop14-like protein n=1 Tax=Gloeophyllum trabeum (strain ATCC 11539 / FP-39264 / Madison 617) TaxID=670483 RepID=S7QGE9_GLOTA|nr:Nop14-like protein [Gloeophyllum trabeum ATCC 11539]EPQ58971.1 Nop14-like protein [Gloeophyllum trabeum ATCC 11539]